MIIKEAYHKATVFLEKHNIENASLNAEVLIRDLLKWDRDRFIISLNDDITSDQYLILNDLLNRRINNEPLQYITGFQNFYGRDFLVNSNVLIPRPETELLVEAVIFEADRLWKDRTISIVDVGTGSGAIAITLSLERKASEVHAVDISGKALEVANNNANIMQANVEFHQGDLLKPLLDKKIKVDLIVSNPPYIPTDDIPILSDEVKTYEPILALDGGNDGLDFYRRILFRCKDVLNVPGIIAFEIGIGQEKELINLLEASGARNIKKIADYQQISRILIAWF